MASSLTEKLIAALTSCPCCRAGERETNKPSDGIPDGNVHETVFECGAAAFVTDGDRYEVGRACPWPLDNALDTLFDTVAEEDDDEDDQP